MTPKTININYTAEDGTTHSREYTDLSQVWHPASEPPLPNKDIIVAAYNEDHDRCDIWHISLTPDIIADFSRESNFLWAYIDDLLPREAARKCQTTHRKNRIVEYETNN